MSENYIIFTKTGWRISLPGFKTNLKLKVKGKAEVKDKDKARTNDWIKLSYQFKPNAVLQSLNVICQLESVATDVNSLYVWLITTKLLKNQD